MMTNNEVMNQIIAFFKDMNGILTFVGSYPTYGRGTGTREVSGATTNDGVDPLASQGSLTLSRDGRFLLAVNTGSNSISSFIITDNGVPVLADKRKNSFRYIRLKRLSNGYDHIINLFVIIVDLFCFGDNLQTIRIIFKPY
jgi:hypothetical protein